jgi:short-subunit dehydrogenase
MSAATLRPAIVVTGASSGIGRELARVAAGEGAFMLLLGRVEQALNELVAELTARGCEAALLCLDLTASDVGPRIEQALAERGLYCDVLVNNAGYGLYGPTLELDRAAQVGIIDVNVRAMTDLALRFLPDMVRRGRGGVLNVGSLAGHYPGPRAVVYYASKAYVRSFSDALFAEVAGTGVTVTCLAPGPVHTPMLQRSGGGRTFLFKLLPRAQASEVAQLGWRGFKAGRRVVMPGLLNRILAISMRFVPTALVLKVMGALHRPGSLRRLRSVRSTTTQK